MQLRKKRRVLWAIYLLLFIVGYYRTMDVGFLSDGFGFIHQCKTEGSALFSNNFHDAFYLPLTHTIAFLQYQLFGDEALWFRLVQYFMHLVNAILLYRVVEQLLQKTNFRAQDQFWVAAFSGALFLISPYQTEAVVWLAGRAYIWCVFFSLIAIWQWLKYAEAYHKKHLIFSLIAYGAACFSKESALILPLLIWGFDVLRERRLFATTWLSMLLFLIPAALYLSMRYFVLGELIGGYGTQAHAADVQVWATHLLGYGAKFLFGYRYLTQILGPNSFYYIVLASGLLVGLYLFVAYRMRKNLPLFTRYGWRSAFVLLVMSVIALLPVLPLEMTSLGSIQSDRYGYFPMVIISMGLIWGVYLLAARFSKWVMIPVLAICVLLTWKTNEAWEIAGAHTRSAVNSLVEQMDEDTNHVILLTVPDNFRGAYMLRNRVKEAYYLASGREKVKFTTISGLNLYGAEDASEVSLIANGDFMVRPTLEATLAMVNMHSKVIYTQDGIVIKKSDLAEDKAQYFYYDAGLFFEIEP